MKKVMTPDPQMDEYIQCHICLEPAEDAVETECCHNVFCEGCIKIYGTKKHECPMCRQSNVKWNESPFIRQIVADKEVPCPYGCKKTIKKSEVKEHKSDCEGVEFVCNTEGCKFKAGREEFIKHILSLHETSILENMCKTSISKKASKGKFDSPLAKMRLLVGVMNSQNNLARPGSTGKFYCGKKLDKMKCKCCNGNCGPTNGCNCSMCMQLDITIRSLPKGYLVNTAGRTAKYSPEAKVFYCNAVFDTSEKCTQQTPCVDCARLITVKERYEHLL